MLPVDGISLVAGGLSQALSVAAVAETGGILLPPPVAYMHKIAVGPQARGAIDISDTPENNLRRVAFAMNVQVQDLTVVLLDRPRHQALLERLRALGARVAIVSDGDVGLAMMAAWPGSGIDVMIGSGGTREAIVAACAMRCLGGELQCRPWVRHEDEAAAMREAGYDPEASLEHGAARARTRGERCGDRHQRWRPAPRGAVSQLVGGNPQPGDARAERDGARDHRQAPRRTPA